MLSLNAADMKTSSFLPASRASRRGIRSLLRPSYQLCKEPPRTNLSELRIWRIDNMADSENVRNNVVVAYHCTRILLPAWASAATRKLVRGPPVGGRVPKRNDSGCQHVSLGPHKCSCVEKERYSLATSNLNKT